MSIVKTNRALLVGFGICLAKRIGDSLRFIAHIRLTYPVGRFDHHDHYVQSVQADGDFGQSHTLGVGRVHALADVAQLSWITQANGTVAIAHGGRGVEVMTGSHSAAEHIRYADTAIEFDLLASRGSDFHSPGESRTELGSLPDLPGQLTPVWQALEARVQHATHRSNS
jgi:hypothetical protein